METAQVELVHFRSDIHGIIGQVKHAVGRVVAHLNDPSRRGGYFCLLERSDNPMARPTLILGIGTIPTDKGPRYMDLAQEKARRLAEYPEHRSSWQSRNPGEGKWGGAIVAGPFIFSLSGLTPDTADEAAMLLAADELDLITPGMAMLIAKESGNKTFLNIVGAV